MATVVKLTLKSFQECVRLETFNRGGYQQIQLDALFLCESLRAYVDDESAVDTLMDEIQVDSLFLCESFRAYVDDESAVDTLMDEVSWA
ncbi:unnamed protein product [Closterium sp. NIES-54]